MWASLPHPEACSAQLPRGFSCPSNLGFPTRRMRPSSLQGLLRGCRAAVTRDCWLGMRMVWPQSKESSLLLSGEFGRSLCQKLALLPILPPARQEQHPSNPLHHVFLGMRGEHVCLHACASMYT